MNSSAIAILLGILSTVQLHIAKAMERQGIEIFDQIRAKIKKEEDPSAPRDMKKPIIYIIGLILNHTIPLYAIFAVVYGPPALFTSVFGIGLVALLFYSYYILKEDITRIEIIGAIILIIGTVLVGIDGINQPQYDMSLINKPLTLTLVVGWLCLGFTMIYIALKKNNPLFIGIIFGLFAGGCGALDPFLKNIGSAEGGQTGVLPNTTLGLIIWLSSFLFGGSAFVFTQWGFARKAPANILVPAYNSTYVVLPVIFQLLILPGYTVTPMGLTGIIFVVIGIVLMRAFRKEQKTEENKKEIQENTTQQ